MAEPSFSFYADTFRNLDEATKTYISDVSTAIATSITPAATQLLIVFVIVWGFLVLMGTVQELVTDGLKRVLRMAVVIGFALGIATYNGVIANFLWSWPDALAAKIAAAGSNEGAATVQYLDQLMSKSYDLGKQYWIKAQANSSYGIPDLGLLAIAIAVWGGGLLATAYSAFLLCLSKVALAAILGIGPVFIFLLLFDASRKFFESWLGQALNYGFLVVLTASVCKLILAILEKYLNVAVPAAAKDATIVMALPALAICLIGTLILMQLGPIASAFGGGAAVSTMGAGVALWRRGTGAANAARPGNVRRSMRSLKADGRALKSGATAPKRMYESLTQGRRNKVANG